MQARLVELDAPEWRAMLDEVEHDVYALPEYVSLAAWHEGGHGVAIFVEDGPGRRLLVPLVVRDVDGRLRDAVSPYGYPGVVTDRSPDATFVAAAMAAAGETLADDGIVSVFVRLHPLIPVAGLTAAGTIVWHQTVAIDLEQPEEQVWSETRRNHRQDILRCLRSGACVELDPTLERFDRFQQLYTATMERLGASSFYRFSPEYFSRLRQALGDKLHLAEVMLEGHAIASGLVTECDGIVQVHLAGADERYHAQRPAKLLIQGIHEWARGRGDRWVHLGGGRSSMSDSLFHYKLGFSRHVAAFGTLRMVVREQDYAALVTQYCPSLDPIDVTGYFPAYRAPEDIEGPQAAADLLD